MTRTVQLPGQLDLLDLLEWPPAPPARALTSCPHCGSEWYTTPEWQALQRQAEHREVEAGTCWSMAEARYWLDGFKTGKKVMEPHHTKADLRRHIAELQESYDHLWARYNAAHGTPSKEAA